MRQTYCNNEERANWHSFAAMVMLFTMVWLGVLPLVGEQPGIREFITGNESQGIDPSAKFYSELPAMPRIVLRMREAGTRKVLGVGQGFSEIESRWKSDTKEPGVTESCL